MIQTSLNSEDTFIDVNINSNKYSGLKCLMKRSYFGNEIKTKILKHLASLFFLHI